MAASSDFFERVKKEIMQDWARSGGKARAKALSPARRSEIARKAVAARWKKWRSKRIA